MRIVVVALAFGFACACGSSKFEDTSTELAAPAPPGSTGDGNGVRTIAGDSGAPSSTPPDGDADASAPTPADSGPKGPDLVVTNETVQVNGVARTFVLVAPKVAVSGKAYPVVFVFHGDGGTGAAMRAGFTLDAVSGEDAVIVYPDGKKNTWDLYTPAASNQDNAFVDAMMTAVKARFSIDTSRVFGSGYSSGAFFINQIACRRTGFFRAIAPNAGGAPAEPNDPAASYWPGSGFTKCANQTGGVAAIIMHGSDDYVVGPGSGTHNAKYWAFVNGCDATADGRTPTTPSPCVQHASCPPDKRVVYCEIPGIGHGVWNESVKATWAFFMAQ